MLKSRFITVDDFRAFTGKDLNEELGSKEEAEAFIYRIEVRMDAFIDANFNRNMGAIYPRMSDYQKEHFKLALLEQAIYIFRNGEVSVDSGYDDERGVIADINQLQRIAIAPNAKQELILCGVWNRHIRGNRNYLWLLK